VWYQSDWSELPLGGETANSSPTSRYIWIDRSFPDFAPVVWSRSIGAPRNCRRACHRWPGTPDDPCEIHDVCHVSLSRVIHRPARHPGIETIPCPDWSRGAGGRRTGRCLARVAALVPTHAEIEPDGCGTGGPTPRATRSAEESGCPAGVDRRSAVARAHHLLTARVGTDDPVVAASVFSRLLLPGADPHRGLSHASASSPTHRPPPWPSGWCGTGPRSWLHPARRDDARSGRRRGRLARDPTITDAFPIVVDHASTCTCDRIESVRTGIGVPWANDAVGNVAASAATAPHHGGMPRPFVAPLGERSSHAPRRFRPRLLRRIEQAGTTGWSGTDNCVSSTASPAPSVAPTAASPAATTPTGLPGLPRAS